ncbi:DedA family protein [Plantactinospora sonchi]|uniref:DedA family protein n=1 Tax=Plantactinospora sonchi TaxID=1544735 RepID=A0ABU7RKU1_9ACTN
MSWITGGLDTLSELPAPLLLLVAALFGFGESGLGVGTFIPGETVALVLAAAVESTPVLVTLAAVLAVGNSAGDHVGYLLGRRYGQRLRQAPLLRRLDGRHWDRAMHTLHRYGAWAVFLTRLLPVVRTLTPAAAGMARVPYAHFLPASLLGAVTWSAVYVGAGAFAGTSVRRIEQTIGNAGLVVLLVLALLLVGVALWRRQRVRSEPRTGPDAPRSEPGTEPERVRSEPHHSGTGQ